MLPFDGPITVSWLYYTCDKWQRLRDRRDGADFHLHRRMAEPCHADQARSIGRKGLSVERLAHRGNEYLRRLFVQADDVHCAADDVGRRGAYRRQRGGKIAERLHRLASEIVAANQVNSASKGPCPAMKASRPAGATTICEKP